MKARGFDRNWTLVCVLAVIGSVLGWLIYAMEKPGLVRYLQMVGFPDEGTAKDIAAFSLGKVGWFILFFVLAVGLCTLIIAGVFAGRRAKLGGILLGTLLVMDLGRANYPISFTWITNKSTRSARSTPLLISCATNPTNLALLVWCSLPLRICPSLTAGSSIFTALNGRNTISRITTFSRSINWTPRMPADLEAYEMSLAPCSEDAAYLMARRWELTNTRYLLGYADYLDVLNERLDPVQHRSASFNVLT